MIVLLFVRELLRALGDPKAHDHTPPWNGRCQRCGHRLGANVRQSRELPPWEWHREVIGRAKAIRYGKTHQSV